MSLGCLPTICYLIPLDFHQISRFLSSILCWKSSPCSFPYWSPSLVLITQLIRLWWLFLFFTSLCFPVWPKAYIRSWFSSFLNTGLYVRAGWVYKILLNTAFCSFTLRGRYEDLRGARFFTAPAASRPLLPPAGRGNPTLRSWRQPIRMQRLQRGPSCPPSSSWPRSPAPRALSALPSCRRAVLKNGFICEVSFQSDQQPDPAPVPDTWQQWGLK